MHTIDDPERWQRKLALTRSPPPDPGGNFKQARAAIGAVADLEWQKHAVAHCVC